MASEYLLKKYKDVKPDEVREMTREEKWRNWWYYHKWHVVIAAAAAALLVDLVLTVLGVGRIDPDYSVAYIGTTMLSEETVRALKDGLAAVSPDMNGDGVVTVALQQYVSPRSDDVGSAYYAQAAQVQMVTDVSEGVSYFFLLEDPAAFQEAAAVLCNLDGSLPEEDDLSAEGKYLLWGDCPVLSGIDLGEESAQAAGLAFARRGFWTEKVPKNIDACHALWNQLTEGAVHP